MTIGTLPSTTKNSLNNEQISKNVSTAVSHMIDPSDTYYRRVAHVETIKVVNNRYSTPVTLKFAAVTRERTINIAQTHVIIFAAIKLLDPIATIKSTKGIVYHHPKDFPYSQAYQDAFEVIVDKIPTQNHIFVSNTSSNLPSRLIK